MDIVVDALTMENLANIINVIFNSIEKKEENSDRNSGKNLNYSLNGVSMVNLKRDEEKNYYNQASLVVKGYDSIVNMNSLMSKIKSGGNDENSVKNSGILEIPYFAFNPENPIVDSQIARYNLENDYKSAKNSNLKGTESNNSNSQKLIKYSNATDNSTFSIFSEIGEDILKEHDIFLADGNIEGHIIHKYKKNETDLIHPSEAHKPLDPVLFRRPFKIKNYGKMTFTIYGMDIDLEILSKKRVTTPVPAFIPTRDIKEDANIRDIKLNAVFYDIKNNKILDPLNGIADMKNGIIDLPLGEKTFMNDFLRVFSIIKTSSKLSLKIGDFISNIIKKNLPAIKNFMLVNKEEIINLKLKRIIMGDYSLKAFKLLYDHNLYDPCIPEKFYNEFTSNETIYSTEIFNMILIAETIIKMNSMVLEENEKFMMYIESYHLEFEYFGDYKKLIETFKSDGRVEENFTPRIYLLSVSKMYCAEIDCKTVILKYFYIDRMKYIMDILKKMTISKQF
jgi:hypothetical protein